MGKFNCLKFLIGGAKSFPSTERLLDSRNFEICLSRIVERSLEIFQLVGTDECKSFVSEVVYFMNVVLPALASDAITDALLHFEKNINESI